METDIINDKSSAEKDKNEIFCSAYIENSDKKKILVKECPKCKDFFDTSDTFCGICGDVLLYTEIEDCDDCSDDAEATYTTANSIICQACGSENFEEFSFCSSCGKSLEGSRKKFCPVCHAQTEKNQLFCASCGASVVKEKKVTVIQKKKFKATRKIKIINSAVLLLFAAALFAFSFLPIFTLNTEILGAFSYKIKFNAYQTVGLAVDNLQNKSDSELSKTALYEDFKNSENEVNKFIEEYAALLYFQNDNLEKSINEFAKYSIKLELRNEDTPISIPLILSSIASLSFVLIAAISLLLAIFTFLSNFATIEPNSNACIKCIIFAPFIAAISYIALRASICRSVLSSFNNLFISFKISSPALWLTIIPTVLIVGASLTQTILFNKKAFSIKQVGINLFILIFSVLTLIFSTSGVLTAKVKAIFNQESEASVKIPIKADFYESFNLNDDELKTILSDVNIGGKEYEAIATNLLGLYKNYTVSNAKDGEADLLTQSIILYTVSDVKNDELSKFTTLLTLLLLCVFAVSLVGAYTLSSIATNENAFVSIPAFSSIGTGLAIVSFILNLMCVKIINNALELIGLSTAMKVGVGIGIICFVLSSILTLALSFIPTFTRSNKS